MYKSDCLKKKGTHIEFPLKGLIAPD